LATNDVDQLWLGYDGLSVRFETVVAVLHYRTSLNEAIHATWGRVPANVRAVVVVEGGAHFPTSRTPQDLRLRLAAWRRDQERRAGGM
jgi:hypothetical protein